MEDLGAFHNAAMCKGGWVSGHPTQNVQNLQFPSEFVSPGLLQFFTAFETDKFHAALCYLVCIGHPGLFFNIFCFPVIQYLSQLVHHCFSLWYFVQNHQPRSYTRMFTMTHQDASSDLILFPYTRVVSGLLHSSSHPPWFKNELFSVSRWTSLCYMHFFPVQEG